MNHLKQIIQWGLVGALVSGAAVFWYARPASAQTASTYKSVQGALKSVATDHTGDIKGVMVAGAAKDYPPCSATKLAALPHLVKAYDTGLQVALNVQDNTCFQRVTVSR